ncbi:hypothetical protein C8A01DRAFT_12496 [Parachaetomium inaequale]|uniref:Uncharacterized protein n=1 Tax=Parachaetomium inaequale TaxID=2588326 RepID=A0AAN6PRI8_9PEZI|nr:hypothetical protein C8A01DRAFT_12496 [Parachaetomium inaequale]
MASLRVTTFANTFLVTNNGRGGPVLKLVGPQETRKKRPHRCDEGDPCRNCVKRKETCVRLSPASPNRAGRETPPLTSPPPELAWCPLSEAESGPINLLHMELLHHFERYSIPTLPFQVVWPRMLQLAFQSRQHTYLVNAMLSFAAAHLDYLHPGQAQYHRAKYVLLNKALHDYREALSAPITADNCDALFGTANLIQFLMWCDLSFMDGQPQQQPQTQQQPPPPLDLSADRLYFLSTGVRQIFFMAWPLFQSAQSAFTNVGLLGPCMALEDAVDARGLNWQRHARGLMEMYDNPRYHGSGSRGKTMGMQSSSSYPGSPSASGSGSGLSSRSESGSFPSTPDGGGSGSAGSSSNGAGTGTSSSSAAFLEGLLPSLPATGAPPYKVMTLYHSYKEGEAYVRSAGAHDEGLVRAAFKRLVARLSVAMAFVGGDTTTSSSGGGGGCPAASGVKGEGGNGGCWRQPEVTGTDKVRYVTTFPMMCFGPLLGLISSGDSRMLVLLLHMYRVVGMLLHEEKYWWCKRRVGVMKEAIGRELRDRGLEVCLRRQSEVV